MSATNLQKQSSGEPAKTQPAPAVVTSSGETAEQALARAQAAAQAKRLHEANGICADVLAASPDHPAALALQGIIAGMSGNPDGAVVLLRRAIELRPGNATWYAHLSSLCRATYLMDEALAAGQESIRLDPNNPEHLVNLSLIFVDVDDRDRATACLLRAIGLKHDHADGHLALAQTLLAAGDFDPGWMEYEWRNLTEAGKATMPAMTSAAWNGMRIPNGRLLLVGDQGYGDTIQFARYIPMAAERCQELIVGAARKWRRCWPIFRAWRNTATAGRTCLATRCIAGCPACRTCSTLGWIPSPPGYRTSKPIRGGSRIGGSGWMRRCRAGSGGSGWRGPGGRRIRTTAGGPCRWRNSRRWVRLVRPHSCPCRSRCRCGISPVCPCFRG